MSQHEPKTEYLIALAAWSSHHVWVRAANEDAAQERAQELWAKDESAFSYKDGGVDGLTVLECRQVQS